MAQYLPEIASKLSEAILERLGASGIETSQIDFNEMQDRKVGALQHPAVNISINQGIYKKITLTTYKCFVTVTLYLMVSELRGEKYRRFMALNLIEAINDTLMLEKLGLDLQDPLTPLSFDNVTDVVFSGAGYQIFQLKFTASYNTTKTDTEEGEGILKRIVSDYYLYPDDGISDQQSTITFGPYGGNAYSLYRLEPRSGGHAGTRTWALEGIFGGNASSTY